MEVGYNYLRKNNKHSLKDKLMKKIGLILANPITNYGAHLQAFATQFVVDQLGIESAILDLSKIKNGCRYYIDWGFALFLEKAIKNKLFKKKQVPTGDKMFHQNKNERVFRAKEFRSRRLHDIIAFNTYDELVQASRGLSAVMIGSDQMWLPGISFTSFNSLRFVPKGVARLSYATSLGVSSYPRYCWSSARDMWKRMDYISVREEQGAKIIKDICGDKVDVKVVVDPTYLLSKAQWESLIPVQKMSEKKYVFCYFLGEDLQAKRCARRFADKHHLHLVSILSCESFTDIDRTFADETVGAASPEEFINWIRGAEYVFTDSFHGLAFSVINHKQFFVFYRVRKDSKQSRNSRIDNILKMWHCEDRLLIDVNTDWSTKEINEIDYNEVESLVSEKRVDSLNYLKKALGVDEHRRPL